MKKLLLILAFSLLGICAKSQIVFRVLNPLYDIDSYVIITPDHDSALALVRKFTDSSASSGSFNDVGGIVFVSPTNSPSLWIPVIPRTSQDFAILNHEIFHLVFFIMKSRGIPLAESSNEAYAYMVSYYTYVIYSTIDMYKNGK